MAKSLLKMGTGSSWKFGVVMATSLMMLALFVIPPAQAAAGKSLPQKTFLSPAQAVKAMINAIKSDNLKTLKAVLGPDGDSLISSGDEIADKSDREHFLKSYEEKNRIEKVSSTKALLRVGREDWPMPISIVKRGNRWLFDTKSAREEILNRKIGRNELSAIKVCQAYVDAQREYAQKDLDGDGLLEYAQKFESDPGRKNGLHWDVKANDPPSPFGPFICKAAKEGYEKRGSLDKPEPYHGYFYKILKGQGKNAPGGALSYVVNGNMIGGFALVAYPALYGVSGIMTFIVNHDGVVYQKDLGNNTDKYAEDMNNFDPDNSWKKVDELNKQKES
jgi:hypothetical protein